MKQTIKQKKINEKLLVGVKLNKVLSYDADLLIKTKSSKFLGIPFDIILMSPIITNGLCHYISTILSNILENSKLIEAEVYSLEENDNAIHSFVMLDNYVYDTSRGYKIEKELYYDIEKPKNIIDNTDKIYNKNQSLRDVLMQILINVENHDIVYHKNKFKDFLLNFDQLENNDEYLIKYILDIIKYFVEDSLYTNYLLTRINDFENSNYNISTENNKQR